MNSDDLEIVSGCAAAHPNQRGGQHVAQACGAVLVIHKPTGYAVRVDSERSQIKCKNEAIARLEKVLAAMTPPGVRTDIPRQCWCGAIIDPHNDCCRAGHLSPERVAEESR